MTGSPYGVTPGGHWPPPATPPQLATSTGKKRPGYTSVLALILAALAVVVAVASWFRPAPESSPSADEQRPAYSADQTAKAVRAICDARKQGYEASAVAGNKTSANPDLQFAIAINVRLSSVAAADYLMLQLDNHPATPPELAESAEALARAYIDMTLLHLSDASPQDLEPAYSRLDAADAKVIESCA
jgi:hypothetical protein